MPLPALVPFGLGVANWNTQSLHQKAVGKTTNRAVPAEGHAGLPLVVGVLYIPQFKVVIRWGWRSRGGW